MYRSRDHKRRLLKAASALALMAPLAMCWPANALAQPTDLSVTPSQVEFGNVEVGQSATQTVTLTNTGSNTEQPNVVFLTAGTPSVWPIENDGCSGQTLNPGDSCQITLGFQPDENGYRDGALVLTEDEQPAAIANPVAASNPPVLETADQAAISPLDPTGPVTAKIAGGNKLVVIGFSGTGMPAPGGAATITGNRAAGSTLTCDPTDDPATTSYSYQWLRNGRPVAGATSSTMTLADANVGQTFSCQVVASNPGGTMTMSSPPTAPIAPMNLTLQPGAFTDEGTCRTAETSSLLRLGQHLVDVHAPQPVTPWAPLTVRSRATVQVSIDGHTVATGKRIAISPRTLSNFADGLHSLQVTSAGASANTNLALLPCALATRLQGGPGQSTTLAASSLYGMSKLSFRLPPGLRIDIRRGQKLGWATFKSAYYPTRTFDILGKLTTWNNTTVTVTQHTITITNLPIETGVVTVTLRAGNLTGHPGPLKLSALERGSRTMTQAATPATWMPW